MFLLFRGRRIHLTFSSLLVNAAALVSLFQLLQFVSSIKWVGSDLAKQYFPMSTAAIMKHEEVFLKRYDRLLKWATQLTRPDHELAKDLVQEAFVQFTLADGDLLSIKNLDNYLFGVVRNAYRTHLRRSSRQPFDQLKSIELDGGESPSNAIDPRRQIQIKDELRAICHYACRRKEKSVTGSVLILRFFHGYVPSEIAKLLHSSRNIVDVQLRSARYEVLACLLNTQSADENERPPVRSRNTGGLHPDLLTELRDTIFATRSGDCVGRHQLEKLYSKNSAVTRSTLNHLVSCPECLDTVNELLDLPPLSERNVMDVLGRTTDSTILNLPPSIAKGVSVVGGYLWFFFATNYASDFLA